MLAEQWYILSYFLTSLLFLEISFQNYVNILHVILWDHQWRPLDYCVNDIYHSFIMLGCLQCGNFILYTSVYLFEGGRDCVIGFPMCV